MIAEWTSARRCSGKTVINSTKSKAAMMAEMTLRADPRFSHLEHIRWQEEEQLSAHVASSVDEPSRIVKEHTRCENS